MGGDLEAGGGLTSCRGSALSDPHVEDLSFDDSSLSDLSSSARCSPEMAEMLFSSSFILDSGSSLTTNGTAFLRDNSM